MINRALQKQQQIDKFIECALLETGNKRLSLEDKLTAEDWQILHETRRILEPFYKQTIRLQSRASLGFNKAAQEAYPSCDFLLRHILAEREKYRVEFAEVPLDTAGHRFSAESSYKHMRTCIENCWAKLDDYYKLLDTLPAYTAAVVLHPGHKIAYFETKWAGQ